MLDTLKQAGKILAASLAYLGKPVGRLARTAQRSSERLPILPTVRMKRARRAERSPLFALEPAGGRGGGDGKEIVVRSRCRAWRRKNCHIAIEGNMLYLSGEKTLPARELAAPTTSWSEPMVRSSALSLAAQCGNGQGGRELQEWRADHTHAKTPAQRPGLFRCHEA